MVQAGQPDADSVCCCNCRYFCHRTGFCRKNPPQVIVQYVNRSAFPTAVFPKISVPALDWCSYFEKKEDGENGRDAEI